MIAPSTSSNPSTALTQERLYQLIPAIYRLRDAAEGEPLRALLAVLEREYNVLEQDIEHLYQNWFIETCDEWVVPYIGDLLDVGSLYAGGTAGNSAGNATQTANYGQQERRAYVANTLAYRRRKGTAPILEQLTQDVTGWRSRAVEFSRLVSTTQSLQHLRPMSTTVNLRADSQLQQVGTPFETQAAYSVEVRPTGQGGRYNASTIGLFIWRLQSYPLERVLARPISSHYYHFNPLGYDTPLFNQPQTETTILTLAQEINVPAILREPVLTAELEARRTAAMKGDTLKGVRYFDSDPVIQVFLNGQSTPVSPDAIVFKSLASTSSESSASPASSDSPALGFGSSTQPTSIASPAPSAFPPPLIAIDPALGRLKYLGDTPPAKVEVSYFYGFSDDIGGGPYGRDGAIALSASTASTQDELGRVYIAPITWDVEQATTADPNPLATAIYGWNQTTTVWQQFNQPLECRTHIPIAHLQIPSVQVVQTQATANEVVRPVFAPGVVCGLEVSIGAGLTMLQVSAGRAVDDEGRSLQFPQPQCFQPEPSSIRALPTNDQGCWTGVLVLAYSPTITNGVNGILEVLPETALDGYSKGSIIPLATVAIQLVPDEGVPSASEAQSQAPSYHCVAIGPIPTRYQLTFSPGIVQGLDIKVRSGTYETFMTAGTGVDSDGCAVVVPSNVAIDVCAHQGQVRSLIISRENQWQPQLLSADELAALDEAGCPYLRLANLDIPAISGVIATPLSLPAFSEQASPIVREETGTPSPWQGEGRGGVRSEISATPSWGGVNPSENKAAFTTSGFETTPQGATIKIGPGTVTDANGNVVLDLTQEQTIDISRHTGRTMTLFVSGLAQQGLPLEFTAPPQEDGWEYVGMVPQQPTDFVQAHFGQIIIRDNGTYNGDLCIQLPEAQTLEIIAADGYRPHIQGDISIQGLSSSQEADQGELFINGILIEGELEILPGNLKLLDIQHCTLVSDDDSLTVSSDFPDELDEIEPEEGISLIAFLLFCLSIIWQLNCQELGFGNSSSPLTLNQAAMLISQQFHSLIHRLEKVLAAYCGDACGDSRGDIHGDSHGEQRASYNTSNGSFIPWSVREQGVVGVGTHQSDRHTQDNSRLAIHLERTIMGPLYVADSVPELLIQDCLIAKNTDPTLPIDTSAVAIAAPGTATAIHTTTVLGRTHVRSLDASDSIFAEKVTVQRQQVGCIRFCYVPSASHTPRRYQCQPDLVLQASLNHIPAAVTTLALMQQSRRYPPQSPYVLRTRYANGKGGSPVLPLGKGELEGVSDVRVDTGQSQEVLQGSQQPTESYVFVGTDGDGLFAMEQNVEDGSEVWVEINGDLSDRHITAILPGVTLYLDDANAQSTQVRDSAAMTPYVLVGTDAGQLLKATTAQIETAIAQSMPISPNPTSQSSSTGLETFDIQTSAAQELAQIPDLIRWRSLPFISTNAPISLIQAEDYVIPGTVMVENVTSDSPTQIATKVIGTGTFFTQDLRVGDYVTIGTSSAQVTRIGRPGSGTITSQRRTVRGQGTQFSTELKVGDTISVRRQKRVVEQLFTDEENQDTVLIVDRPFRPAVPNPKSFVINQDTELFVDLDAPQDINPQSLTVHLLWVGTLGDGLWRGRRDGCHWEAFSAGLTNLAVTTLKRDRSNRFWLGTDGDGIFQFTSTVQVDQQRRDRWVPFNTGLTNGHITALTEDAQDRLWLGTEDGLFSFGESLNQREDGNLDSTSDPRVLQEPGDLTPEWIPILEELPDFAIATLAAEPANHGDSLGDSLGNSLEGSNTDRLLIGTADGKVIYLSRQDRDDLLNGIEPSISFSLDFRGTDVTAAVIDPVNGDRYIGTAVGDVMRSRSSVSPLNTPQPSPPSGSQPTDPMATQSTTDSMTTQSTVPLPGPTPSQVLSSISIDAVMDNNAWVSINTGLPDVAKTLEHLNQIQPSFTSNQFGNPAYGQLSQTCVPELRTGAEDGAEMGVFNSLKQPQREANLHTSLDEYLRFGLTAGIFYIT